MTIKPNHWRNDLIRPNTRKATNKVLEMVDEGLIDYKTLAECALKWMSEDDVKAMCAANEIDLEEIEINEEYRDYSEDELRKMGCFDNLNEDEEEEPASYILFAGETKDSLYPLKAFRDKDEAIADAQETVKLVCPCAEVCYMPEDDLDTNEVIWSNCGRK